MDLEELLQFVVERAVMELGDYISSSQPSTCKGCDELQEVSYIVTCRCCSCAFD